MTLQNFSKNLGAILDRTRNEKNREWTITILWKKIKLFH